MGIEVKPGHWRQRDGRLAVVRWLSPLDRWPWKGHDADGEWSSWQDDGHCLTRHHPDDADLVEYLGPEEPVGGAS